MPVSALPEALGIRPGITAAIGGGGKTALLRALAAALAPRGRVLLCTTTRIHPFAGIPLAQTAAQARAAFHGAAVVCAGEPAQEGKLAAPREGLAAFSAVAEYILVEADGARGRPLKAHAAHEPAVPEGAARVIAVCGLDAIGAPIAQAAHRPGDCAALLGVSEAHCLTPRDVARLLRSYPPFHTLLLNKADLPGARAAGEAVAALWGGETVLAALSRDPAHALLTPKKGGTV